MRRYVILAYGLVCYAIFFCTFLYAIWFVFRMDATPTEPVEPLVMRLLVDAGLLALFALQHSIMARQSFKKAWTRIVPEAAERSTYVLFASLALLVLIRFWQPLLGPIWKIENHVGILVLQGLFILGWLIVLISTFLIDHFELFGLKQVWCNFTGKQLASKGFVTPGPYKFVRHPIYLGFIISLLEYARHDCRTPVLCCYDHCLHFGGYPIGRAGPHDNPRGQVSRLSKKCIHAYTFTAKIKDLTRIFQSDSPRR